LLLLEIAIFVDQIETIGGTVKSPASKATAKRFIAVNFFELSR